MITVSVLYPNQPDLKFDKNYYTSHHIPMVERLLTPALKKVAVEYGISGPLPGTEATYAVVASLFFESVDAFIAAFTPHAAEIQGDIPNYCNVAPVIQINEVAIG